MTDMADPIVKNKEKIKFKIPARYHVLIMNDNLTPMEWVVKILKELFHHSEESAYATMLRVHTEGSAIAGTYSYEIAEQKASEAIALSRENGFPLQFNLKEE